MPFVETSAWIWATGIYEGMVCRDRDIGLTVSL